MNISFGSRVSGAVVCPDERRRGEEMRVVCGWGESGGVVVVVFGGCVVGSCVAPVSSARLVGNMLPHILSLSETLVCIPVAWLSKVF